MHKDMGFKETIFNSVIQLRKHQETKQKTQTTNRTKNSGNTKLK